MKISHVRVVSAFFAFAALAVVSRAQDRVTVNIPYEFVAAGKTLPAGTYRVDRLSGNNAAELSLTSFENHTGVLLISSEVSSATADKPALSFEVVGDQHFLSKIETADHIYTFPVSAKAAQVVAKNQSTPSTSGASGSN
jgi:hypothetical protein